MTELFTSEQLQLKLHNNSYFREEIFVSLFDAHRAGLSDSGQFCIFALPPLFPGPQEEEFAVRVEIDPNLEPGIILVNQHFLDSANFRPGDERFWVIKKALNIVPVKEAVIELVVEQGNIEREINNLRARRRDLFINRCFSVEPGQSMSDFSLHVLGRGYFNFRSIQPTPDTVRSKSIFVFNENTVLNLFVPHRKSGVDMVVVVDASGSMDLCDYVGSDGRPRPRIQGVREAMEVLLQRRIASGSRVSSIASVVFGKNVQMLYPSQIAMVELQSEEQVSEMRKNIRDLSSIGLKRKGVDRSYTDISRALQYAAELLDYYAQEGNEKMLILLSDGADWTEDSTDSSAGEIVRTMQDPAVLADSLHYDSQIRIHTVSISDEQALRRYEDSKYWTQGWAIPNTKLLEKMADFTEGLFIPSPDASSLAQLFDELGEGALYPV